MTLLSLNLVIPSYERPTHISGFLVIDCVQVSFHSYV